MDTSDFQKIFKNVSQKKIRHELSERIDTLGTIFKDIAGKNNLFFRCEKNNRNYVELGGGNKTTTFKIWFDSEILKRRTFLKVQLNFVDLLLFKPQERAASSLLSSLADDKMEEIALLFPEEYARYTKEPKLMAYDMREIFCEKTRAILTRRGFKARDFLDIYLISNRSGLGFEDMRKEVIRKTDFALKLYSKYRKNFEVNRKLLEADKFFDWKNEMPSN